MEIKQSDWVKFTWCLENHLKNNSPTLPEGYELRFAAANEFQDVMETIINAYKTEPVWNKIIHDIRIRMTERVGNTLGQAQNKYLAIYNFQEMVAVSGVCQYHWTNQNFLTGICVRKPFQRKGLGKFLLFESLRSLRESGLQIAEVFTEKNSLADTKIYPLYQSVRQTNVDYLFLSSSLYQLPVRHNIYYKGNVQSLGISTDSGYATAGVIKPGEYQFSTSTKETVYILRGELEVRLPEGEWELFKTSEFYEVPSGITFDVRNICEVLYLCYYH